VHALSDVQDTPDRVPAWAPLGLGVVWIVQVVPSQLSAKLLPAATPTAVHAVAEVHDTPDRALIELGFGVRWIVHVVPFQLSATVITGAIRPPSLVDPTAAQAVADVHETPDRLDSMLLVLGVVWMVQAVPFQRSASAWVLLAVRMYPTAVHAAPEVHETPERLPLGLGVVRIVQAVPSQRSAKPPSPTAVHAVADVQDTPSRTLDCAPLGLGVVWIVQAVPSQRSASVTSVLGLLVNV
jgi:hypothetical protein